MVDYSQLRGIREMLEAEVKKRAAPSGAAPWGTDAESGTAAAFAAAAAATGTEIQAAVQLETV